MENIGTKRENTKAIEAEFWKGIMLGTMAGMIIAAFTYQIVDRDLRSVFKEPETAPDQSDANSTLLQNTSLGVGESGQRTAA
jgi:hypothetical protein